LHSSQDQANGIVAGRDHPAVPPSGYRCDKTHGIAVGDEAQTVYAVVNGSHYNSHCCFDCAHF